MIRSRPGIILAVPSSRKISPARIPMSNIALGLVDAADVAALTKLDAMPGLEAKVDTRLGFKNADADADADVDALF